VQFQGSIPESGAGMASFRDPSLKSRGRGGVSGIDPRIRRRDGQFQGSIPEIKA